MPRLFQGLGFKISVIFIITMMAMLVLLNTYPVFVAQNLIVNAKNSDMISKANQISTTLSEVGQINNENISRVISLLDIDKSDIRIVVTDKNLRITYDSKTLNSMTGKYLVFSEAISAASGYDVFKSYYDGAVFESRAAVPVIIGKDTFEGVVFLYERDGEKGAFLKSTQTNIRTFSISAAIVMLIFSIFFSRSMGRKLEGLLQAIVRVRQGDYNHRVEIAGGDEISEIAKEFNELSGRLQKTEELRREFVSNASHELKTPLSSIKLLADSIIQTENMDKKEVREFLTDIVEEIDRLTRITEKLLLLTKLDIVIPADLCRFEMSTIIKRVVDMLKPLEKEYNVTINVGEVQKSEVLADRDGAYQMVLNLVENAMKYNTEGGSVDISLTKENDKVILKVKDTGIGIPEEDIPKIFERFYRVDKARSRETGGSGLGLSIVKNWVTVFGGTIDIESTEGKGTTFTVMLPSINADVIAEEGGNV